MLANYRVMKHPADIVIHWRRFMRRRIGRSHLQRQSGNKFASNLWQAKESRRGLLKPLDCWFSCQERQQLSSLEDPPISLGLLWPRVLILMPRIFERVGHYESRRTPPTVLACTSCLDPILNQQNDSPKSTKNHLKTNEYRYIASAAKHPEWKMWPHTTVHTTIRNSTYLLFMDALLNPRTRCWYCWLSALAFVLPKLLV